MWWLITNSLPCYNRSIFLFSTCHFLDLLLSSLLVDYIVEQEAINRLLCARWNIKKFKVRRSSLPLNNEVWRKISWHATHAFSDNKLDLLIRRFFFVSGFFSNFFLNVIKIVWKMRVIHVICVDSRYDTKSLMIKVTNERLCLGGFVNNSWSWNTLIGSVGKHVCSK